jgi:membrane-bound serine protease (ClpP class)
MKKYYSHILFSFSLLLLLLSVTSFAQTKRVMIMEVREEIAPPIRRYVEVALAHAEKSKADIIIIDMDTFGGSLQDALDIVDRILKVEKPVWVYINKDAASAGALISIACDSIYMTEGGSIGAATVVGGAGEKAPEKYQSYMKGRMRALAEAKKRNPAIAEKMVDETIDLAGISPAGQLITFTSDEAIKHGYCEGKVNSIEEILKKNGVIDYKIDQFELNATEEIIAFFLNPAISGILILMIIGGLYFEVQSPGLGLPGLLAVIALILYLVPYYLTGIAENWEIICLFIGIVLIGVEIFVLPGFGIAGITGITLTVGSLILIMVDNDFFNFDLVPGHTLVSAVLATFTGILGGTILLFVVAPKLGNTRFYKKVALTTTQDRDKGYTASFFTEPMKGKIGTAHTVLRPSGKVMIDNKIYDAFTQGGYIERGAPIEVIGDETTSLRVKQRPE